MQFISRVLYFKHMGLNKQKWPLARDEDNF